MYKKLWVICILYLLNILINCVNFSAKEMYKITCLLTPCHAKLRIQQNFN